MRWFEKIIRAHTTVTQAVRHGEMMDCARYFVWLEDGRGDLWADDTHAEHATTGKTDLFTPIEFDPWVDELEQAMDADPDIAWELTAVTFDEKTRVWRYEWTWSVTDGED